ncbi:unnamed protein product, partial [Trichogramma brassicae]
RPISLYIHAVFEVIFSYDFIVEKRYVSFYGNAYCMDLCIVTVFFFKSRWTNISKQQLYSYQLQAVRAHKSEARRKNRLYNRRSRASGPCPRICIIYKTQSSGGSSSSSSSSSCTDKKTMYICFCTARVEGVRRRCTGGQRLGEIFTECRYNFPSTYCSTTKTLERSDENYFVARSAATTVVVQEDCVYRIKEEPSYTLSNAGDDYAYDSVSCKTKNFKTFPFQELSTHAYIHTLPTIIREGTRAGDVISAAAAAALAATATATAADFCSPTTICCRTEREREIKRNEAAARKLSRT